MRTVLWIVRGMCGRVFGALRNVLGSPTLRGLKLLLSPLSLLMILAIVVLVGLPKTNSWRAGSGNVWKLAQTSMGDTMYIRGRVRMARNANLEAVSFDAELLPIEIWSRSGNDMSYMVKKPGCVMISNASVFGTIHSAEQTPPLVRKQGSIWQPFAGFISPLLQRGDLFLLEEQLSRVHSTTVTLNEWTTPTNDQMISITIEPSVAIGAFCSRPSQTGLWFDLRHGRNYTFDRVTGRLASVLVFADVDGQRMALFETDSIDYDVPAETLETVAWELERLLEEHSGTPPS